MPTRTAPVKSGDAPLLQLTKQLELVIRSRLDELLRPAGLTSLQYAALTVVERHQNLTSAQLARSFFVTAQTMADLVGAQGEAVTGFVDEGVEHRGWFPWPGIGHSGPAGAGPARFWKRGAAPAMPTLHRFRPGAGMVFRRSAPARPRSC